MERQWHRMRRTGSNLFQARAKGTCEKVGKQKIKVLTGEVEKWNMKEHRKGIYTHYARMKFWQSVINQNKFLIFYIQLIDIDFRKLSR